MIHCERLERRFGPQILFSGLSWMIPRGARIGLVGPNGTGKTTLLRILIGQDTPDAGEVRKAGSVTVSYLPQEVETISGGSVLGVVLEGRGDLSGLESRIEELERRMSGLEPGHPDLAAVSAAYGEARHRFEALGGDEVEAKAKVILGGLGVPEARMHDPIEHLSGGWRMRVVLGRILLSEPDLLLLDEPTNHLDLEAIVWLEQYLETFEGALVVVSHDRYFLNRMASHIVELERGKLTTYAGNYDDYITEKELREEALEVAAKRQKREIARVEKFIDRFRYKNTKARQVQSRIRTLSKIERIDAPSRMKKIRFGFPPAPRSGDVVARATGVRKAYGDTVVYDGMNFLLRRGERLALVGPNGAGKSTLLKLLSGRIDPEVGQIEPGHNVSIHYYAQHQLESLDPRRTVLEEAATVADAAYRPRLRSLLGSFLLTGDDVDKKVASLSGGEKARLALAKMLIRPANLLLLDEPTNHLDLKSREILEEALDEFGGSLVVISHDRYFINRIATSIGEVGGGLVETYPGDYDTFLEHRATREVRRSPAAGSTPIGGAGVAVASGEATAAGGGSPDSTATSREFEKQRRRDEAEERNRRYRERRVVEDRLGPIEAEIAVLEKRVEEIDGLQADPSVYSDPDRAREVAQERAEVQGRLEALYYRWNDAAEEIES